MQGTHHPKGHSHLYCNGEKYFWTSTSVSAVASHFFASIKSVHARWSPIVLRESSSNASDHGLSSLMAPDYKYTYLLLMMTCGLIIKWSINIRGVGISDVVDTPSILKGWVESIKEELPGTIHNAPFSWDILQCVLPWLTLQCGPPWLRPPDTRPSTIWYSGMDGTIK